MSEPMHERKNYGPAYALGIALNVGFVAAEAYFGIRSQSLALVADAGHNLSDVLSLGAAWGAAALATKPPSPKHSYGFRASTILVSLFNALLLLFAMGGIAWEAIQRFSQPGHPAGSTVMLVAGFGVLVNGVTAWLFLAGQKEDINVRGAFLHMAADTGVSVGVVVAGLLIATTGFLWIDPVVSLAIVAVVLVSTWRLLRDSLHLAMQGTPRNIDADRVRSYLSALPEVESVHDLHIWAMSTTEVALSVHLVAPRGKNDEMLGQIVPELLRRFGIEHPTVQIERGGYRCRQAAPNSS